MVQSSPFFFPTMTTKAKNRPTAVKRRIQHFYDLLNQEEFARCFVTIDPRVRVNPASVTQYQYENSLRQFLTHFGRVRIVEIQVNLHLDEPSKLYEGRDFATGRTIWEDQLGERHVFSERWVRQGRSWYTRSTGLITPAVGGKDIAVVDPKIPRETL
jgi:hypothetical protein